MSLLLSLFMYVGVAAHAADGPQISVQDDGTVVARMLVNASPTAVRSVIPDVQQGPSSNVLSTEHVADGSCFKIVRRTKGLWNPLTMNTRLCPTSTGWRESLISSDDFNAYETEWSVRDDNGQSAVQIKVKSEVNFLVPNSLVQSGAIQGMRESFATLLRKLLAARSTP